MTNLTVRETAIFNELKAENPSLSEEELLAKTKEIIEESDATIEFIDNRATIDILVQFEIVLSLHNRIDLLGIIVTILFFNQIGFLKFTKQKEFAEALGLSEPTLITKRNELIEIGLIDVVKKGKRTAWKLNAFESVKSFSLPNKSVKEQSKYLQSFRKTLTPINNLYWQQKAKEEAERQQQIIIDEMAKMQAKQIVKKKAQAKKKDEQRFPNEDYEIVLNAFKKYKGVGLLGPEVTRAKRAIKQMFLATRTPKQIVDCMKFFKEHQHDEEYKWLSAWTLETVMKKIPEFLAGTLKQPEMGDDLPDL